MPETEKGKVLVDLSGMEFINHETEEIVEVTPDMVVILMYGKLHTLTEVHEEDT